MQGENLKLMSQVFTYGMGEGRGVHRVLVGKPEG